VVGFGAPLVLVLLVSMPRKCQVVAAQVDLDIAVPQVLGHRVPATVVLISVFLEDWGSSNLLLRKSLPALIISDDTYICICRK
jgi:hypothetical protein